MQHKELKILVEGLKTLSTDIAKIANDLDALEDAPVPAAPVSVEKTYSFEEVRGILSKKAQSGHREAVIALITKYGGSQLSDYKSDPAILAKLAAEAEVIGNG